MKCSRCGSENLKVIGKQKNLSGNSLRIYKCLDCNEEFSTVEQAVETELLPLTENEAKVVAFMQQHLQIEN